MKFDKEVDKILSECLINEGLFDVLADRAKSIAAQAAPTLSPYVAGLFSKNEKDTTSKDSYSQFSNKVAKEFLIYRFKLNPKKRIKIYGTLYSFNDLLNMLTGKTVKPILDGKIIKTKSQLFDANKKYTDLKKAASLIKNKDLNTLNLTNNPSLKGEIQKFIKEKSQFIESYTLKEANQKPTKKEDKSEMTYDKLSSDEVLKSLVNVLNVPFSSNHPDYIKQKIQYLFALSNDGQVIK